MITEILKTSGDACPMPKRPDTDRRTEKEREEVEECQSWVSLRISAGIIEDTILEVVVESPAGDYREDDRGHPRKQHGNLGNGELVEFKGENRYKSGSGLAPSGMLFLHRT